MRIAVDVGGTFTDAITVGDEGNILVAKIKSTPAAPEEGFLKAIENLLVENKLQTSNVDGIVHIGTIGTNLFLGQMGLKMPIAALITTKGFRDVIEIGRQNRPELYNIFFERPTPLVSRKLRFEVSERVDSDGIMLRAVSGDDLENVLRSLKEEAVETVAISYLNSYINSRNEEDTKQFLSERLAVPMFTSSDVDPEHREYERTSTTVVNAVLSPIVSGYLECAMNGLKRTGIDCGLQILSSGGGLVDVEEARSKPIITIESGPAAGVVGASEIARLTEIRRLITLDMGGTSAKAGCVLDYLPLVVPELEVGGKVHMGRIVKGSGYPVRCASIDLAEVSAGGGTIIWADKTGNLKVGPISAGASPGPACYDAGGEDATVTDANLVLGRIDVNLLGGRLHLSKAAAEAALERIAKRTNLDLYQVAANSLRLVNLQMAKAVHLVSLERGLDPREFVLLAFGGAGPMHAAELAEEIGVERIIVPPWPGLFSALSMLLSDVKYAYVRGMLSPLDAVSEDEVELQFLAMTNQAQKKLQERGLISYNVTILRSIDLRYTGQGYELEVAAPTPFQKYEVSERFEGMHETVYGYRHEGESLEVTALRITIVIHIQKAQLPSTSKAGVRSQGAPKSRRKTLFSGNWCEASVYSRELLPHDFTVSGPSIIEEYDSTIVVPPGWNCERNNIDCLILRRGND